MEGEFREQLKEVEDAAELAVSNALAEAQPQPFRSAWGSGSSSPALRSGMLTRSSLGDGQNNAPNASPSQPSGFEHLASAANTSGKLLSLYQEKLAASESVNAELRAIIASLRQSEVSLREHADSVQGTVNRLELDNAAVSSSLSASERERRLLADQIADLELQITRLKEKTVRPLSNQSLAALNNAMHMDISDAHAWWGYVWHECKRDLREDQRALEDIVITSSGGKGGGGIGLVSGVTTTTIGAASAFNRLSAEDAAYRSDSLRELADNGAKVDTDAHVISLQQRITAQRKDLREQAIELSTVRQVCSPHNLCLSMLTSSVAVDAAVSSAYF
jgi:hypothetical protein